MLTLDDIRSRLTAHAPERFPANADTRQAAVAVILREIAVDTEVLFIKRAEQPGDPWSGHMAFPGGHKDRSDADLRAAAMRETLEEIGLELHHSHFVGELSQQRAAPRGRTINMLVAPYVFEIEGDPRFAPNHEVAEVVWSPIRPMFDGSVHDSEHRMLGNTPTEFNGYRLAGGHFVWGLTYRMLQGFFNVLDPNYVPPDEAES